MKAYKKEIFKKYPLTEKEKQGCRIERERMNWLRSEYRKQLEQKRDSQAGSDFTEAV